MQTFQDFEIIIVDDCSTDKSAEIVLTEFNDDRIKIVHNEKNLGLSESRNRGLDLATGEYIYFMDSDDAIFPQAFEIFINTIEKYDADFVHSQIFATMDETIIDEKTFIKYLDADKQISTPIDELTIKILPTDRITKMSIYYCLKQMYCGIWLNLYSRKFLKRFNIKCHSQRGEDLLYLFETLMCADKIVQIPNCVYSWRINSNSITHNEEKKNVNDIINYFMLVSSQMEQYFEIFDEIPQSLRFHIYNACVQGFLANHGVKKLYKDDNAFEQTDLMLQKILQPIFGDQTLMLRELFHGNSMNLLRMMRKAEI